MGIQLILLVRALGDVQQFRRRRPPSAARRRYGTYLLVAVITLSSGLLVYAVWRSKSSPNPSQPLTLSLCDGSTGHMPTGPDLKGLTGIDSRYVRSLSIAVFIVGIRARPITGRTRVLRAAGACVAFAAAALHTAAATNRAAGLSWIGR